MSAPRTTPDLRSAPALAEALRRASARLRAFRAGRAALTTTITVMMVLFGVLLWETVAPHLGAPGLPFLPMSLALGLLLFVGTAATLMLLVLPIPADHVARELDRRMDLDDRASTAVAVLRGQVGSALSERIVEDTERTLHVALPGVRAAFPARPGLASLRQMKRLAVLVLVVVLGAWIAGELPGGAPFSWGLLGKGVGPDGPIPIPAEGDPLDSGPTDPDADAVADSDADQTDPDGPPDDGTDAAGRAPDPEAPLDPDQEIPGEGARVTVAPQFERFRQQEPIIVVVEAFPTVDLERPTKGRLELSLDGQMIPTTRTLEVHPDRPGGDAQVLDLRQLPEAAAALQPGEHTLIATFVPDDRSRPAQSAPATFHVLGPKGEGGGKSGGDDDSSGNENQPSPDPQPEPPTPDGEPPPSAGDPPPPDPSAPPDAPETAPDPPAPPGANDPGGDADPLTPPTPEFEVAFEDKLVLPLFGEGQTVKKHGPRLVLVPGDASASAAREALENVLPDARRRAEAAVDRARVSKADRDLVRRYFERLLELLK